MRVAKGRSFSSVSLTRKRPRMSGKDERSLSTICAVLCVADIVEAEEDVELVEDWELWDTLVLEVVELGSPRVNMKSGKTAKTDHFYLSGHSDPTQTSQPSRGLFKQPTRNSTQSTKPRKRPKWSRTADPEKEHSRGMTKAPNQNAPRQIQRCSFAGFLKIRRFSHGL